MLLPRKNQQNHVFYVVAAMASTCSRHPGICRFWHTFDSHQTLGRMAYLQLLAASSGLTGVSSETSLRLLEPRRILSLSFVSKTWRLKICQLSNLFPKVSVWRRRFSEPLRPSVELRKHQSRTDQLLQSTTLYNPSCPRLRNDHLLWLINLCSLIKSCSNSAIYDCARAIHFTW